MSDFSTPAGWYPDGDGWERRWDGAGWTDERRRAPEPTQVRPSLPPSAPPAGSPPSGPPQSGPTQVPPTSPPSGIPLAAGPGGNYGHIPSTGIGVGSGPVKPRSAGPSGPPPGGPSPFGGYGAPPAPAKKSRAWIWVTLAVVLILGAGTGITLAVVKPWSDDDSSSKTDDDKDKGSTKAIQGDIDGDGLGDASYFITYAYDNVKQVTAISDGEKFETKEVAVDPRAQPQQWYFDWDGDGVNEDLTARVVSSGGEVTLTSSDDDWPGDETYSFSFASLREYGDPEMVVNHGDFDGDGNEDIVVAGQKNKVVDVYVLTGDGKGGFADPSLWISVPNAVVDAVQLYVGDFDKDGDDDLWTQLPSERLDGEAYTRGYYGDRGYALLTSDGKAFSMGAVVKSSGYYSTLLVGDVTGDGTDNIVAVESNSYNEEVAITVFDVSGGAMSEVTGFTGGSNIGDRNVQSAQLSDVDGDGKADVVFAAKNYDDKAFSGVQVMKSTGAVFESATVWADIPACPDDNCRIQFQGTPSRY